MILPPSLSPKRKQEILPIKISYVNLHHNRKSKLAAKPLNGRNVKPEAYYCRARERTTVAEVFHTYRSINLFEVTTLSLGAEANVNTPMRPILPL